MSIRIAQIAVSGSQARHLLAGAEDHPAQEAVPPEPPGDEADPELDDAEDFDIAEQELEAAVDDEATLDEEEVRQHQ